MSDNNQELFAEFSATSTEDWEAAIIKTLKGKDYNDTLIWNTIEGLEIRPYYRAEDLKGDEGTPGQFPFTRGNNTEDNDWDIRADITSDSIAEANKMAISALMRGANNLSFDVAITSQTELNTLLSDVIAEIINLNFSVGSNVLDIHKMIDALATERGLEKSALHGGYSYDPVGNLIATGNWYDSEESDLNTAAAAVKEMESFSPFFKALEVNATHYHNAGASITQELGCALAHGHEYLAQLTDKGCSVDAIARHTQFHFSVGSNYFLEIAKLRAARQLWSRIVKQYEPADENCAAASIHCSTSNWNKATYDPYVNMLRVTTEAMAASLGGCNSLSVTPFNSNYQTPDEFANRIAQNVQIVLKEESYFNKIVDPAAGSYYIETLTDKIAESAWKFFQQLEAEGGLIASMKSGFMKAEIEKTAAKKKERFKNGELVLLGVNKYPNKEEKFEGSNLYAEVGTDATDNYGEPLQFFRLADDMERKRMSEEASETVSE